MIIEAESPEQYGYDRIRYNLTESSTTDKSLKDVGVRLREDMALSYGDHLGQPALRNLIAQKYDASPDNVMVTAGACMALFIAYSALLCPGDRVLAMHPNYPANIEIPRSLGCEVDLYGLTFETEYRMDVDRLISMIKPETKVVSITYPHNPTGTVTDEESLRKLMGACEANECYLLFDETYGDLTVGTRLPHVSGMSKYGVCVESLSKAIGVPGIRIGWVVANDENLFGQMLAAREQMCICGSALDEECARQIMEKHSELMSQIKCEVDEKRGIVCDLMENQSFLDWVKPQGGVVFFPRIKSDIEIDAAEFYKTLNDKYGVFVGPGRWFDMDDRYFRIGYGWPSKEDVSQGMRHIIDALQDVCGK
jgi:aspartate/methionine/tyrosine aminotransferase